MMMSKSKPQRGGPRYKAIGWLIPSLGHYCKHNPGVHWWEPEAVRVYIRLPRGRGKDKRR